MIKLVLWDIDHTLVDTRGVGRELFAEAFEQTTGRGMERQARIDGMTDPVIFHETARLHQITACREDFDRFARALGATHLRRAPELRERGHALPGAAAALSGVASLSGVTQTVVTGNIRASAEVKLRVFGLDSWIDWDVAAFGEDADERAELVRLALARAEKRGVWDAAPASTVLIGDTPSDVHAGLTHDVHVIGVATGRSDQMDLRDAGADTVLESLEDTEHLLAVIKSL